MEERYVRCRRCHDAFDPGQGNCPQCGAEYVVAPDPTAMGDASYTDKYQGTEFGVPLRQAPVEPSARRSGMGRLLGPGVVLVVMALAVGLAMVLMGAFNEARPLQPNDIVVSATPTPTPTPSPQPFVEITLARIGDPAFNAHVSIQTKVLVNARVSGSSHLVIINTEVDMAGGTESGTYQTGNLSTEFRIVGGTYYSRQLPTGKWSPKVEIPSFLILSPLFSITEARQLKYDGPDTTQGAAQKLSSTAWWVPDILKLSGVDINVYSISPQKIQLTLYVRSDGVPVHAVFHAWTDAVSDGTRLLDIESTYTFTSMGGIVPVPTPTFK